METWADENLESQGKDSKKKVIKEKQLDFVRIKEREDFKAPSKFLHWEKIKTTLVSLTVKKQKVKTLAQDHSF